MYLSETSRLRRHEITQEYRMGSATDAAARHTRDPRSLSPATTDQTPMLPRPEHRPFSDTGTLINWEDATVFYADGGGAYSLETVGRFRHGDCVLVSGILDVDPQDRDVAAQVDGLVRANKIELASQHCDVSGKLVPGPGNLLLADNGLLYVIENTDGHAIGDRVRVTGVRVPLCASIYDHGDA